MKKILSLILALVVTTTLWAYDFQSGDLYYNITSDTTVEVTCQAYDSQQNYLGLTSVTIPETVTHNSIIYSVTSIGNYAFQYCYAFFFSIPNSVTSIENFAFNSCLRLTSITIPNSVKTIGDFAFYNCHFLISVTIPNSVMSIGNDAFALCAGLSSITIPNSVTSIGSFAFGDCIFSMQNFINNSSLNEKENNYWGAEIVDQDIDGLLIRNDTVIDCRRYAKSAIIPSSVTTIGEDAFRYCNSLISITIPNSIISIGDDAFSECYSLASVVLPESISRIGKGVFSFCYSLTTFNISNSITNIGEGAFMECSGLISLTIPNSITTIGEDAFSGCTFVNGEFKNNSSLSAEENNYWGAEIVDQDIDGMLIRNDTIFNCRPYITSAIIPNNITCIGDFAFGDCEFLDSVIIPNSVTSIGEGAFTGCYSLTFIVIPNSITSIEEGTFAACESLTSINIPNSITNISGYAFQDCPSLKNITIPNSVTNIGELAFSYCYSLTSVSIGNGVMNIGRSTFKDCSSLDTITCLATTPPALGRDVFDGCENPTLFVPCEALEAYQTHEQWGQFTNIQCIASEEVETDDVIITPSTTSVTITWPTAENAYHYVIEIKKDGEVFCTLTFNAEGQLLNIAFAPARDGNNHPALYAEQVANGSGLRFTVTGLEEGTNYTYNVVATDQQEKEISSYSGEFTTQSSTPTNLENVDSQSPTSDVQKIMHNGQLIILRDGKTYTIMGAEIQ